MIKIEKFKDFVLEMGSIRDVECYLELIVLRYGERHRDEYIFPFFNNKKQFLGKIL